MMILMRDLYGNSGTPSAYRIGALAVAGGDLPIFCRLNSCTKEIFEVNRFKNIISITDSAV